MKALLPIAALLAFCVIAPAAEDGSTPLPPGGSAAKVKPVDFQEQLPVTASHAEALVKAAKEKRLVMTIFASSDCPHCNEFRQGVLATPEFRAFAKEKLVLVIFDITQFEAMSQNEQDLLTVLKERYQVKGTPHMVIETPSEKRIFETEGYLGTPAEKVIADIQKLWATTFGS